jgi:hypothetical protein
MSKPTNHSGDTTARKRGRPRGGRGPIVPWQEADRLLVFGEVAIDEMTGRHEVRYPSYRELARRYGVSVSLIATYASKHQCIKRRHENCARARMQFEELLRKKRAEARTISIVDAIALVDDYMRVLEEVTVLRQASEGWPAQRAA